MELIWKLVFTFAAFDQLFSEIFIRPLSIHVSLSTELAPELHGILQFSRKYLARIISPERRKCNGNFRALKKTSKNNTAAARTRPDNQTSDREVAQIDGSRQFKRMAEQGRYFDRNPSRSRRH